MLGLLRVCRVSRQSVPRVGGGSLSPAVLTGGHGVSVTSPASRGERGSSARGLAREGKWCPQRRPGEFYSSAASGADEEWRLQPRSWWLGTGTAPLWNPGTILQAFHLLVKHAVDFSQGFPSTPLLHPHLLLCKPPPWCLSPGEVGKFSACCFWGLGLWPCQRCSPHSEFSGVRCGAG